MRFKRHRIGDLKPGHIHDVLAVVSHQRFAITQAQLRRTIQSAELLDDPLRRHGNHLYRQRKLAEGLHQLGFICNTHKLARQGCHNFFTGERRTASLDHVSMSINLVGTVDVNREFIHVVGIKHGDAQRLQAIGAGVGA